MGVTVDNKNQPPPDPSDEVLVARVVLRDVTAFALLYDRYVKPVYAMAVHMLGSNDAEEIVQEVFLRLWNRAGQYNVQKGSFKAWFMAIARYRILDELRQRSRQQQLMVAEDVNQLLAGLKDPMVDVEKEVWLKEHSEHVLHALKLLPAEQRRALVLAYFGGLSQSTIAQHLGWPLGTVKKRIRLGMQKLRRALAPLRLPVDVEDGPTPTDAE